MQAHTAYAKSGRSLVEQSCPVSSHAPGGGGWGEGASATRSKIIKWPLTRPRHSLAQRAARLLISITGPRGASGPGLQAGQVRSLQPGDYWSRAAGLIGHRAQDRTPGPQGAPSKPIINMHTLEARGPRPELSRRHCVMNGRRVWPFERSNCWRGRGGRVKELLWGGR